MSFQPYGDPKNGQVATRPPCWGSRYDSESRECRACGWQNSCREHIIQLNVSRPPTQQVPANPTAQMLAQFPTFAPAPLAPPVPVQQPQNLPPPPAAPPVQQFRPPPPPAPVPAQQVAQQAGQRPTTMYVPPPMMGGYGSVGDPMFNVIGASPAPIRPQYEGETFWERVAKNSVLSGIEAMIGQVLLGVRQARWYPKKPAPTTIEVGNTTPQK